MRTRCPRSHIRFPCEREAVLGERERYPLNTLSIIVYVLKYETEEHQE